MASSNKHWPSLFKKKKPSNNQNWQHGINSFLSTGFQTTNPTSGERARAEERTPEPKPRWNPRPQQIRILETIFDSGTVNPTRDQIRRIRIQLQEFGNVADANVFYWFQNRKSRSKNKQKQQNNPKRKNSQTQQNLASNNSVPNQIIAPPHSSSSSSSEQRVSDPNETMIPMNFSNVNDGVQVLPNSPTISVNQNQQNYFYTPIERNLQLPTNSVNQNQQSYIHTPIENNFELPKVSLNQNQQNYFHTPIETTNFQLFTPPPPSFSFPMENNSNTVEGVIAPNVMATTQGLFLPELPIPNMIQPSSQQNVEPFLNHDMVMNYGNKLQLQDQEIQDNALNLMNQQEYPEELNFSNLSVGDATDLAPLPPIVINAPVTYPSSVTQFQGVGEADGPPQFSVIINNVIINVEMGPINIREAFGDEAVLYESNGFPVLTDEWGVTVHSLIPGATYYLLGI